MLREPRLNVQGLARRDEGLMSTLVADPGHTFVSVDLSAGEPTCYPEYCTEFLTPDGWKRFDEISEGERVAQVDPESYEVSFVYPLNRTDYIKAGEFVELRGRTGHYVVTGDHKLLYCSPKRPNKRRVVRAAEHLPTEHDFCLQAGREERYSNYTARDIWLAALIAADGSRDNGRWDISLYRERKKLKARDLLGPPDGTRVDRRSKDYLTGDRWKVVFSHPLLDPTTKELNLRSLGINQVGTFVEALLFWDGSGSRFFSKHRHVVDHIQAHLCRLGVTARVAPENSGVYALSILPNKQMTCVKNHKTFSDKTRVVCFQVPKGFLVVRQFKRYPWISGNCTAHFSQDRNYYDATFGMVGQTPYFAPDGMLKIDDIYLTAASFSPLGRDQVRECFGGTIRGTLATEMWNTDPDGVKKELADCRSLHKLLVLGMGYAMGPRKMVESAYNKGYVISLKDAKEFYKAYWQAFYKVKELSDRLVRLYTTRGYLINEFGYRLKPDKDHKVLNYFIQSTVSGIVNCLCYKFFTAFPRAQFVTVIHDEIILQVPDPLLADAQVAMDQCVESLNNELQWTTRIRCGWAAGKTLYEAK